MSDQSAEKKRPTHWWGVFWPRAAKDCSAVSRAISVLGGPVVLLLGLLIAVGEIVLLPIGVCAIVGAAWWLDRSQPNPHDSTVQ